MMHQGILGLKIFFALRKQWNHASMDMWDIVPRAGTIGLIETLVARLQKTELGKLATNAISESKLECHVLYDEPHVFFQMPVGFGFLASHPVSWHPADPGSYVTSLRLALHGL